MRHFLFKRKSLWICSFACLILSVWALSVAAYETKSNRANRVRVEVKPVQFAQGKPAKFQIRMNTHSVPLTEDMLAVCALRDNQGREYRPVNWDGSPPGGHHRSGILEFPPLEGQPQRVTLIIKNVAKVPERSFQWKMRE